MTKIYKGAIIDITYSKRHPKEKLLDRIQKYDQKDMPQSF